MKIFKCGWCNKNFRGKPRKYCSDKCKELAKESKKKYKNSFTRGGHTLYEYKKFKKEVLKERNYTCQMCKAKANIIHHLKPISKYPELELVKSNVIAVCLDCHIKCHPELSDKFMRNSLHLIGYIINKKN